ncbi:uncharacterized protein M421DRAFT_3521 [Didymella exigua CBS 183.55]|uniref:Retroviral polymerase SH3-like domain-containing protein n=1 Tax=Didymella exigua CBS 183.55 TaxID=1150837 RepID=A0A6A5RS95_9PLEO|nr:uncharacterized protein M421DRAFT_3521 [Didymella exigua CBS 183.55]KAF1930459.1 hypothetical protein M421DRAFT_3521 [Didymella exigua CBS 183.55]
MLQATAVANQAQPPLLTRWILDPGSNCHVTNTRGLNWTTIKKGEPADYFYAGGVLAQIEEWGEVVLSVKTLTGQSQMKLTYVAYIPGFFTSVVGLSRSRPLGVHFDSGRDCLYQGEQSNVICLLQYQDGHWLIDDEKEQAPPPALLKKLASRALIGQLVGYDSTNIYQVWMPTLQRVIQTRDVVFLPPKDRTKEAYPSCQRLREIVVTLNIPEAKDDEQETNEALRNADDVEHRQSEAEQAQEQLLGEAAGQQQLDKESTARWLLTLESTPELNEQSESSQENKLPRGWQALAPEADAPDRQSNNAPRQEEISSQIDASNVLTSRRQQCTLGAYYTAFAVAVNSLEPKELLGEEPSTRLQRDKLPPPPQRWRKT